MIGGPPHFLTRKLLYTAITRAKKLLILIGRQGAFYAMIKSNQGAKRQTALLERIRTYGDLGV